VQVAAVSPTDRGQNIFQLLGPAPYFVITTCVLLTAMIALFAVPVMLAEEAEKKTLDALVMIASYTDVIIAKALVGLSYTVVALGLLFGLTRAAPQDVWGFIAAIFPLSLALIGFGLLLGGLFRSATQLNTWSSFILLPVVAPIFVVGLPLPEPVRIALLFVPTSQGTRLAINAMTGEHFFSGSWLAYLVIVTWGALAFALLQWRLSRYDA
jgi:hypothetical protein